MCKYVSLCICICVFECVPLQQRAVAFLLAMLSISLARGLDDSLDSFLLPTLFLLASAAGFNGLFYWQLVVHIYLALVIFPGPPNSRRRCLSRMRIPCASAQFSQHRKRKNAEKNQAKRTRKIHSPNLQSLPSDSRSPMPHTPACLPPNCDYPYPNPDSRLPSPHSVANSSRLLRGCCAILFSSN